MELPFPLTHRGEIECKRASDAAVLLDRMLEELLDAGLQNVQVCEGVISFEGARRSKWRRKSRNRFASIDVGEIEISTKDGKLAVTYRLRFRGLLLLTAASVVLAFWQLDLDGNSYWYLSSTLWIAVSWLVALVGNYTQATTDFAAMIRRVQSVG